MEKKTGDKKQQQPMILASSLASPASWMQRYWEWIMSWLRAAWKGALVASRTTEVALRLSPLALLTPLAVLTQSHYWNDLAWRYTISAVQAMGPVAVKFCQWVATRRDIFPPHICDGLGILHDKGYPHSWDHTHQVLTDAFGDYEQRGLQVGEVIGCGSAAQVYKGTLTEGKGANGGTSTRTVAIKVLHPKFSWSIERDLALMESVAEFLHSLPSETIRMINLPRATENFGNVLKLQADLTNEASNLHQFRTNFYQNDTTKEQISSISFPKPVPGWSSPRVLVEEYVEDAIPIATYLQDSSPKGVLLRRELAGPLLRAFLKMVFVSCRQNCNIFPNFILWTLYSRFGFFAIQNLRLTTLSMEIFILEMSWSKMMKLPSTTTSSPRSLAAIFPTRTMETAIVKTNEFAEPLSFWMLVLPTH